MGQRISHSILDPWLTLPLKGLYSLLRIPKSLPPEGIVLTGHLVAIAAAFGFAFSTDYWWGGLLVVLGVTVNHICDCLDGTHARATHQCRNGGELLDHFLDPLSFSYWIVGMAVSFDRLDLGLAGVIILYSAALLTSIKAKLIGEFTLSSLGPTEFKAVLVLYGISLCVLSGDVMTRWYATEVAYWFFVLLLVAGIIQLIANLVLTVGEVNTHGVAPDTSEWETVRSDKTD